MKCEVLCDTVISVQKGSIVNVSEKQYELARKVLKPIIDEKPKAEAKVEAKAEEIEVRAKKKKK